ncbi:MAG TPA: choice-of-anchor tandem repeat GloVer-containing protein [Ideonella sp.]|nr:choice-of-anchor tandem repeat GloVer-containing protein [Ideonella sp.]
MTAPAAAGQMRRRSPPHRVERERSCTMSTIVSRRPVMRGLPTLLLAACLPGPLLAAAAQPDGAVVNFHVMHHIDGYEADRVDSPLVAAQDGNLYGVSRYGGLFGDGTLFRMAPDGTFKKLHTFEVESEASRPQGLVQASDGHFYGTARYGGWTGRGRVYRFDPPDSLKTIHDFRGPDGSQPANAVIVGTDGALYGTTFSGGAFGSWGTAFRMSTSGETDVLHSFSKDRIDGFKPCSRLAQGSDGDFYGTTWKGGRHGRGMAFRLTAQGEFAMLHEFDGSDGEEILSGLTEGPDGLFYGVAYAGGANGVGTLFRLSREGEFAVLLSFERHTHGAHPSGDLLLGRDGYLYGVTQAGGRSNGTLYRIAADGAFSVLHNFNGSSDGKAPLAGLVERDDGEFFGVTSEGGKLSRGTIFRLRVK